jgi:Leucine-rich repeat (LRR) protein
MAFDPNKALAIIFGASQWPNLKFPDSSSTVNPFQAAAQGMRDYLVHSLQLPAENVLFDGLFDSPAEPAAMVRTINAFLAKKTEKTELNDTDLFIYFVGHGALESGKDYYLCIHSTGEERASQFDIEYLMDVIKPVTTKLRYCYIIIDACYSGGAYNALSNIKKVRTLLLCSSSRGERSQGATEEITRFTGALLTVLKQPQAGDWSFSEVFSSVLEHVKTPTPEIYDINPTGSHASKAKVLRSYSNTTPNSVPVKKGRVVVNKKLKWAIGIVLLGSLGMVGKVWYDSLLPLPPDRRLIQQLQTSLQPQLGERPLESPKDYQEDNRQRVVELSLAGLGLSTVPEEVWQLKQLQKLNLYNNNLETLPEAIGNLELLKYLKLERNQLRELPASLGNLKLLEQLDLRTNQLKELPEELTAIGLGLMNGKPQNESEKGIFIADNLLEVPPREKVQKGMERVALVEYFKKYPKEIRGMERAIGKRLPLLENVEWNSQGYRLNEANQVMELGLWNMELSEVPTVVWQLSQLRVLWMGSNKLTKLPEEIGNLKQLQFLYLLDNELTELPPQIGQLQQLWSLRLGNNKLTQLPPEIWNLNKLTQLFLASNQLTELPPGIEKLQQLIWLDLSENQLTQLPKEIGNLEKLKYLDLTKNRLTELPQEILSLALELKFEEPKKENRGIFLGNNPLQVPPPEVIQQGKNAVRKYFGLPPEKEIPVPKEIRKLEKAVGKKLPLLETHIGSDSLGYRLDDKSQVMELSLYNLGLTEVPKEIWQLQRLQKLGLSNNRLTKLPKEIGQLQQLGWLSLGSNQLTDLPKEVWQLQQLWSLDLSSNQLTKLPPEIGTLKKLSQLFSADNQLTELPAGIGNLQLLYWLDLSQNKLIQLPTGIGNLKHLGYLDLGDNHLTELPKEISLLKLEFKWEVGKDLYGEKGLFLGNNPLQVPPPEVIQQGREAVVKYFQERGR